MTTASVRAAAQHIARTGIITPHQLAAFTALDQSLSDAQRQAFTETWRADGSPAAAAPESAPGWLPAALKIIKEFEGCHLKAYLCPAGVPTIGWGSTAGVKMGGTISQACADQLLTDDMQARHQRLLELLPMVRQWPGNRAAALVSWAYNVGMRAVQDSTLRKRLMAGEDPGKVVSEELPRWDKANGKPLAGLTRRRAAEVALFVGQPEPVLTVPAQQKVKVPAHLRLTRTGRADSRGLHLLRLQEIVDGIPMGQLEVVSGAPGRQAFRIGRDSRAGSAEPLPEGRYAVGHIEWANGTDNYQASWGPGLGAVWVGIEYRTPGRTDRAALGIHHDENHGTNPGTAGCIGIQGTPDLKRLVAMLRAHDPKFLLVDWRLGTCPSAV
jgi:GH24 family phage-related lysozyme (muramidase)